MTKILRLKKNTRRPLPESVAPWLSGLLGPRPRKSERLAPGGLDFPPGKIERKV